MKRKKEKETKHKRRRNTKEMRSWREMTEENKEREVLVAVVAAVVDLKSSVLVEAVKRSCCGGKKRKISLFGTPRKRKMERRETEH